MADPTTFIATWFTPSSLFILVNLVIGTIAITSRFGNSPRNDDHHHQPQLAPSPSLLQRIRSFNLRHYNNYHYQTSFLSQPDSAQPQLVPTPSLLERVKSFSLSLHRQEPTHAETQSTQPEPEEPSPKELVRTPSLLQRLQSINLLRLYRSDTIHREQEDSSNLKMVKSASEKAGSRKSEWEEEKEEEERVERRRPATTREVGTASCREDEEVDAKADDFINRFKKQLRLQRIDSIIRYRELMRG